MLAFSDIGHSVREKLNARARPLREHCSLVQPLKPRSQATLSRNHRCKCGLARNSQHLAP
eukprot:scaffold26816_cov29-Tisochrysis_lutea.AAC.3